jgi:site-specific recombinase XerD
VLTDSRGTLLTKFLASRRQGLSQNTIAFYKTCLKPFIDGYEVTPEGINTFLATRNCRLGGKLAYFRAVRVLVNWLVRNDYIKDNPLRKVDPPKPPKPILPSFTLEEVQFLIDQSENDRDKAIVSLFSDSGMRLNELVNIKVSDINWANRTILIWGKGNKQRKAPFTNRTELLLRSWLSDGFIGNTIWRLRRRGIEAILESLKAKTGLPCNPHTFRRTFASNLHRAE